MKNKRSHIDKSRIYMKEINLIWKKFIFAGLYWPAGWQLKSNISCPVFFRVKNAVAI
jgi:hypothetical protein